MTLTKDDHWFETGSKITLHHNGDFEDSNLPTENQTPAGTPTPNEALTKAKTWASKQVKSCFTVKTLRKRLPIIDWLSNYSSTAFQADIISGVTVGLTVIPQGIAYANVAGLPLQYGLYTAFMGCFVYVFLGSTRTVNIGPTAIIALLTAPQALKGGGTYAVLLAFICGIIELLFAILNLGFLIDFISVPVISGFSSAAALIISATQLKGLLGIKFEGENFIVVVRNVFSKLGSTRIGDLVMGICSLIILLALRWLSRYKWKDPPGSEPTTGQRAWRKAVWLICTGRNALVVLVASIISYLLTQNGIKWLSPSGKIQPGLPPFRVPDFTYTNGKNETLGFGEILGDLGSSLALIPLVSILEHIAIAKVFAQGRGVDAKQEFFALGVANLLGSFVSAFPATGSFSRSALNASCGVKSPIGGLYTGILVVLALAFLAPFFEYIPKASLSAVIISAVIFMIEYELVPHLWKTKKAELVILFATFLGCLGLSAEYGILIGIGVSILFLLYTTARPTILIKRAHTENVEYLLIQPKQNMYFPAVEHLRLRVKKAATENPHVPVIFDGSHFLKTDFTIGQCLQQILDDFQSRNQKFWFINTKQSIVDFLHHMEVKEIPQIGSMEELDAAVKECKVNIDNVNEEAGTPNSWHIGGPDSCSPELKGKEVVKLLSIHPAPTFGVTKAEDSDELLDGKAVVIVTSGASSGPNRRSSNHSVDGNPPNGRN